MKLSDYAYNKYSQFGEDGIIEKIFSILGTKSRVCVEFGAWDGFYLSNTANLWTNGWHGILIESDPAKYRELVAKTASYDCHCILGRVSPSGDNTIEAILHREGVTEQIDLLSIDIDGDDYHILASLTSLRPRVIVCEFNPTIPAEMDLVPTVGNYFGCSASALIRLAETKDYALVSITDTNCFFVSIEDAVAFTEYETSLDALKITKYLNYLMSGYDGKYIVSREPIYGFSKPSDQRFSGKYVAIPRHGMIHRLKDWFRIWRRS